MELTARLQGSRWVTKSVAARLALKRPDCFREFQLLGLKLRSCSDADASLNGG
jgi:hypothetical protein